MLKCQISDSHTSHIFATFSGIEHKMESRVSLQFYEISIQIHLSSESWYDQIHLIHLLVKNLKETERSWKLKEIKKEP